MGDEDLSPFMEVLLGVVNPAEYNATTQTLTNLLLPAQTCCHISPALKKGGWEEIREEM